jgi:hypothetical protein
VWPSFFFLEAGGRKPRALGVASNAAHFRIAPFANTAPYRGTTMVGEHYRVVFGNPGEFPQAIVVVGINTYCVVCDIRHSLNFKHVSIVHARV